MFLNSIKGLNKLVEKTSYYKNIRPSSKPVLVDRCNFVIHSIIERNKQIWELDNYKEVALSSKILRQQLGKDYKSIINLLIELEIIEVNHRYISSAFVTYINSTYDYEMFPENKKYGLTNYAKKLQIGSVGVLSKKTEERLMKFKKSKMDKLLEDDIHKKVLNNLCQLQFDGSIEYLQRDYSSQEQKEYYQNSYDGLNQMNECTTTDDLAENSFFYYTQSPKVNRVFHYYATTPKEFRIKLSHKDGSKFAEIDLKNSQPFFIALNYVRYCKEREIIKEGGRRDRGICGAESLIVKDVLKGEFYNRVADYSLKQGNEDFYNLHKSDYSAFKAKVLGEGLYFNLLPLDSVKTAEKYLIALYPDFMDWIRSNKYKYGYKSISIDAQRAESNIFIKGFFKDLNPNEFAVPVHDSIIVKVEDVEQFKKRLTKIIQDAYSEFTPSSLSDLLKVDYYD